MAGGPRKIQEYNESLTPEQRKQSAKKAAKASAKARAKKKTLSELAKVVAEAPIASEKMRLDLKALGFGDEDMVNSAIIIAAVFQAAVNGNMTAVEKWESYMGGIREEPQIEEDALTKALKEEAERLANL